MRWGSLDRGPLRAEFVEITKQRVSSPSIFPAEGACKKPGWIGDGQPTAAISSVIYRARRTAHSFARWCGRGSRAGALLLRDETAEVAIAKSPARAGAPARGRLARFGWGHEIQARQPSKLDRRGIVSSSGFRRLSLESAREVAAPPIGGLFMTTNPERSRCSTRRWAMIAGTSSSALRTRFRPLKAKRRGFARRRRLRVSQETTGLETAKVDVELIVANRDHVSREWADKRAFASTRDSARIRHCP